MEVNEMQFKEFQRFKLIPELAVIKDRIKLFESKYQVSFEQFEKQINEEEENFEHWDSYIEWKAYIEAFKGIKAKLENLHND